MTDEPRPDPMDWCKCGHTRSWHTDNPKLPCLGSGEVSIQCECKGFVLEPPGEAPAADDQ